MWGIREWKMYIKYNEWCVENVPKKQIQNVVLKNVFLTKIFQLTKHKMSGNNQNITSDQQPKYTQLLHST